jgi:hypothetical protein
VTLKASCVRICPQRKTFPMIKQSIPSGKAAARSVRDFTLIKMSRDKLPTQDHTVCAVNQFNSLALYRQRQLLPASGAALATTRMATLAI